MNRKKCVICHEKIDFNKDRYVRLTDFEGKNKIAQCFYHIHCWQNSFKIEIERIKQIANGYVSKIVEAVQ